MIEGLFYLFLLFVSVCLFGGLIMSLMGIAGGIFGTIFGIGSVVGDASKAEEERKKKEKEEFQKLSDSEKIERCKHVIANSQFLARDTKKAYLVQLSGVAVIALAIFIRKMNEHYVSGFLSFLSIILIIGGAITILIGLSLKKQIKETKANIEEKTKILEQLQQSNNSSSESQVENEGTENSSEQL